MKTAGIIADNYKLDKFKEELTKKGFTDFKVVPFTKETSTIKVQVQEHQIKEIHALCHLVEIHFKRSN